MILFCLLHVRIEKDSALVRELLNNNSLFVSQLYADKLLALRARDLISQLTARADLLLNIQYFQQCKVNGVIASV